MIQKMDGEVQAQRTTETGHNGIFQKSSFNSFISQFHRKKHSEEKEKSQCSSRSIIFYQGSDHKKSNNESGKRNGEPQMTNFKAEVQCTEQTAPSAESEVYHQRIQKFLRKLGKQPYNKSLDLTNCALSTIDAMELVSIIPLMPDLEEVDLSWNEFIEGTLEPLILQFKHMPQLKILQLSHCRLTVKDIALLGEAFESVPHLEILDLSWNINIGGSLSLLALKIPKGHKLKTLKMIDCCLTPEDGESIAQLLTKILSLEVLDLSINKMIGCSLRSIAQELKNVSSLKVLNLTMCGIRKDGFQCLATAFQHLLELRKLDVSCNKEIGGSFQNLGAYLACLSNLEVLDLHQCCITEEDMAILTQIIPLLSSLQELNLSSNKRIGASSEHLLSRLRFLPKLKSVLLSSCSLPLQSFVSLAEAALHLPELQILDLSWNKCVGGNVKLISKALNLGAEIQVLSLCSCNLMDKDLADLALVIQAGHLTQLKKLDLSYNNDISDEGWTTFYHDLAGLEQLCELDVSQRPSSCCDCGEWFSKLLAALTNLLQFTELGLQGWVLSEVQRKQLETFNQNNARNIRFDI